MIKKLFLTVCAAVMLAVVSSCGKLEPLTADHFVCNPNPLVEEGGQVNATVTITYPEKYFNKKATLTITPVLEYAAGETKGTPVTFQGEKVAGNDQEINYKYGGTATFRCSFLYKDEMASSKLRLDLVGDIKGKQITLPSVYIADGVIATESLCSATGNTPAYAADNFVKDTFDKYIATMIYQYQSTNLRASESAQKAEVKAMQDAITATKNEERRQFEGLDMVSTASPEGRYDLNERLAAGREKSSAAYLQKFLKKAKMEGQITPEQIAEDWDGFKQLVENSNIPDKQLVLNVLGRISDPAQREQEIRNLSAAYKELEDEILPQLRYSKVTATVRNIGHTDEEIKDLWANSKDELTIEELLYLANMSNDNVKEAIYKYTMGKFSNDQRAANDLAGLYYKQGNAAQERGTYIHAVLQDIRTAEEADEVIHRLYLRGDVDARVIGEAEMTASIKRLLAIPQVQSWFRPGLQVLNELTLMDRHGNMQRPDRIVIDAGGKATVIDYKTGNSHSDYSSQVRRYMRILQQMGFAEVDGYLLFLKNEQVKRVRMQ